MNHRPSCDCNCISQQQYLYEGKVRDMEKELSKLSKCLFDTQQAMKVSYELLHLQHHSFLSSLTLNHYLGSRVSDKEITREYHGERFPD